MVKPIFISYARGASAVEAQELYQDLGGEGGLAFLDDEAIEAGEQFPSRLARAVVGAQVVVIFAGETYFTRWYCVRELMLALTRYLDLLRHRTPSATETAEALKHIVVGLDTSGGSTPDLTALPPAIQTANWPNAKDTRQLAELVRARLVDVERTARAEPEDQASSAVARLLETAQIPPPRNPGGTAHFPTDIQASLGDGFFGRANDLWRLHFLLSVLSGSSDAPTHRACALHGGAGFGKSRIAVEYVWRFGAAHYPGGIFWVDARVSDGELTRRLHRTLTDLEPKTLPLPNFLELGVDVRSELRQALARLPSGRRVLFVVDNVPEPAAGESPKPLRHWCPGHGLVSVIATSRLQLGFEPGLVSLSVETLDPQSGKLLLSRDLNDAARHPGDLTRISELVGQLPLALELLNRILAGNGLPPSLLVQQLQEGSVTRTIDRQADALSGLVPKEYLGGLAAAIQLTWDRLDPVDRRAVKLLAQVSSEPIPESLLNALAECFPSRTRASLRSRALVAAVNPSANVEMFGRMHETLADFARNVDGGSAGESTTMCTALSELLSPSRSKEQARWPKLDPLITHAEVALTRPFEGGSNEAVRPRSMLAMGLGALFLRQGRPREAHEHVTAAYQLAKTHLGEKDRETLRVLAWLAESLQQLGKLNECRDILETLISYETDTKGGTHPDVIAHAGNLASTLRDLGELAKARDLEQNVLAWRLEKLGEHDSDTIAAYLQLGVTLFALGELAQAKAVQERALELCREIHGREHLTTLAAMNNLAGTLQMDGELAAARTLREEVLRLSSRLLNESHPTHITSMANLAAVLRDQGDYTKARELEEMALDVLQESLGSEHPLTVQSMANLAQTVKAQGDLNAAYSLQDHVLRVTAKRLPLHHPDRARAAWNMMHILIAQENTEAAVPIILNHLAWLVEVDPSTLTGELRQFREQISRMLPSR